MDLRIVLAAVVVAGSAQARASADYAKAEAEVKAAVRATVAGINAHNPDQATAYDARDVVSMESGRPDTIGRAQDRAGFKTAFGYVPSWRISL
jgi:ketosteroid isomerase-like protein